MDFGYIAQTRFNKLSANLTHSNLKGTLSLQSISAL